MAGHALKAVLLIGSNLFMIPPIIFGYKIQSFYVATNLLVTMVVSILYHTCDSTSACLGGISVDKWRTLDHMFANNAIVMVFIILIQFDKSRMDDDTTELQSNTQSNELTGQKIDQRKALERTNQEKFRYYFMLRDWGEVIRTLYTYAVIIYVFLRPTDETITPFVIMIGNMALYIKIIMLSNKNDDLFNNFYWQSLIIGLVMGIISIVFYCIDNLHGLYWLWHSLWHILGFSSLYFIQMGMTRHRKNWHGLTEYYICDGALGGDIV
jgi:hypothetical protein